MSRVSYTQAMCAFILTMFVSMGSFANEADKKEEKKEASPGDIVNTVTANLLSTVKEKEKLIETDPDAYFAELRGLLEPAIDFKWIARKVMGKKSWKAVEDKQQMKFVDVFTDSLVRTYGKAMSSFVDLDITVAKTWPSDNPKSKSYFVQQDVKLEGGTAHIVYSMYPSTDGWMVRNVTIRDAKGFKINMGKVFYSQFQHSLSENKGDVVATIDAWGSD